MTSNTNSDGSSKLNDVLTQHQQGAVNVSTTGNGENYEPPDMDPVTLKRNPKVELSRMDLLKLLSYLEGELQARDIVIATLKNEKVKNLLCQARYGKLSVNDPVVALQRDSAYDKNQTIDEALIRSMSENQMAALETLIASQRNVQAKMAQCLRDAEARHAQAAAELAELRVKYDQIQGDTAAAALQQENSRLGQELETERQTSRHLETELKRTTETLEEERSRQKHIVLLLLAERKKLITRYLEERKRCEELTQILKEEKNRSETMAEGLEEESKKSLQMEAELERSLSTFINEKLQLKNALAEEERRYRDLLSDHDRLQRECERLRNQLSEAHQVAMFQAGSLSGGQSRLGGSASATSPRPGQTSASLSAQTNSRLAALAATRPAPSTLTAPKVGLSRRAASPISGGSEELGTGTAMSANITKAVQPTATVSSVPVSAPMTGVAHGVQPGVVPRHGSISYPAAGGQPSPPSAGVDSAAVRAGPGLQQLPQPTTVLLPPGAGTAAQVVRVPPRVTVPPAATKPQAAANKSLFHVTSPVLTAGAAAGGAAGPTAAAPAGKKVPLGRGVTPPVPPTKPPVPPNKPVTVKNTRAETVTQVPQS